MIIKATDKIKFFLRCLSCMTICTLVIITAIQVVMRYVFHQSLTWVEELGGIAMIYITYCGAAMATINNSNTRIDFFIKQLPKPVYRAFEVFDDCVCIAFLIVLSRYAWKMIGKNLHTLSTAMKLPIAVNYVGEMIGCLLMIAFYLIHLYIDIQKCKGVDMTEIEEALNQ